MSGEEDLLEALNKQHSFNATMQIFWCGTLFVFGPMMIGVILSTNRLGGVMPFVGWLVAVGIFAGAYVWPILYFGHMQVVVQKEIDRCRDERMARIRRGLS